MDPFSKWVEIPTMPPLHSWRVTKFLYDDLVSHWGKLCYIWTDNRAKFVGALHGSVKGWASAITTSPLAIVKPMGR